MSLNKVFLLGRLGADPEMRYTQSQTGICSMKIATNDRRKNQEGEWVEHTEWHNVVVFGRTAENCNQYLSKGRQVFIEGRIQTRKYQDSEGKDRYWTEIVANNVQFVGGRGESMDIERSASPASAPQPGAPQGQTPASPGPVSVSFDDDDIPF